jgi:hypothetical protein
MRALACCRASGSTGSFSSSLARGIAGISPCHPGAPWCLARSALRFHAKKETLNNSVGRVVGAVGASAKLLTALPLHYGTGGQHRTRAYITHNPSDGMRGRVTRRCQRRTDVRLLRAPCLARHHVPRDLSHSFRVSSDEKRVARFRQDVRDVELSGELGETLTECGWDGPCVGDQH